MDRWISSKSHKRSSYRRKVTSVVIEEEKLEKKLMFKMLFWMFQIDRCFCGVLRRYCGVYSSSRQMYIEVSIKKANVQVFQMLQIFCTELLLLLSNLLLLYTILCASLVVMLCLTTTIINHHQNYSCTSYTILLILYYRSRT